MKLSEALREGCKSTVGITGNYLQWYENYHCYGACAIGAIGIGYGKLQEMVDDPFLHKGHMIDIIAPYDDRIDDGIYLCPEPDCDDVNVREGVSLIELIIHLNDTESWSREEIATWLEEQGL